MRRSPQPRPYSRPASRGTLKDGQNDVTISSLAAQTDYVAYFAARTADGIYYKDVVEVKFTTVDSPAVFAVEVTGQTQSTVSVKINSVKIAEYAYLAYTPETLPRPLPTLPFCSQRVPRALWPTARIRSTSLV